MVLYESFIGEVHKVQNEVKFGTIDGSIFTVENPHTYDLTNLSKNGVRQ